jgi:hypothetical protein
MKNLAVAVIVVLGVFIFSGCMVGYEGISVHNQRQMTPQDIVTMTKEGVDDSLIVAQIRATRSVFSLTTQDILNLKKEGVADSVIGEMISTTDHSVADEFYPRDYYYYNLGYLYGDWWWNSWGMPFYYPMYHFPVLYQSYYFNPFFHSGHFYQPHNAAGRISRHGGHRR